MKRYIALACALAFVPLAWGQLYKWVDKEGKVHYSDTPPPSQDSKQLNVQTGGGIPPPAPAAAKEPDKGKVVDAKDAPAKAEDDAKRAAAAADRCNRARNYLKTLTDGGRIVTYDAKGERQILDDTQIESEKARAQKAADESCKAS